MQRIDSHQHFWLYHPVKDNWITDDMSVIQRDFLPGDLSTELIAHNINGCIAIQASQSEDENAFLMDLAQSNTFIKGIVGWVDLKSDDLELKLQEYAKHKIIKGFRHVVQAEPAGFMLDAAFQHGISLLAKYDFTYDILINCDQLKEAIQLVDSFPNQRFVIDHLAKPKIKAQEIEEWHQDIIAIVKYANVYCKVSGFSTEADWNNWDNNDLWPYFDVVFNSFGIDRVMFGSDWPVNLLAGGYGKSVACLQNYTAAFSPADKEKFWGGNATFFYKLYRKNGFTT